MIFRLSDFQILGITENQPIEIIDYGVRMVGAPLEWGETMGEGVKVGIIDTGIDYNHPDLKYRIADVINTIDNTDNIYDENGHGTHIAGIIAAEKNNYGVIGVAPKAELYVVKAFAKDGTSKYSSIEKAINWLIEKEVDVINMSFSSSSGGKLYTELIRRTNECGISIICAAGNEGELGDNTIGFPAKFKETIAVSAVDINKNIANFSSKGNSAEICAAGINIFSTYPDSSFALLSGTSMAAPIITGAVALLQGKGMLRYGRKLTPDEIRLLLNIYTENLSKNKGWDNAYGYGLFSFGRISVNEYIKEMNQPLMTKITLSDIIGAAFVASIAEKYTNY